MGRRLRFSQAALLRSAAVACALALLPASPAAADDSANAKLNARLLAIVSEGQNTHAATAHATLPLVVSLPRTKSSFRFVKLPPFFVTLGRSDRLLHYQGAGYNINLWGALQHRRVPGITPKHDRN